MAKSYWQSNKSWLLPLIIIGGILLILILWFVSTYNTLIITRENVATQLSNVDVQYQRRADLVPNLVQTVAGAANFEKSVLTEVTDARSKVGQIQISAADLSDPEKMQAYMDAQAQLGSALNKLIAVAESYPDIKTSENFLTLQSQLEGAENRIAVARRDYNTAVRAYNIRVQRIPSALVANMFGFNAAEFFQADEGADQAPVVNKGDFQ